MARLNNTYEFESYFGANKETISKARKLRNRMTRAEKILWTRLKERKIYGLKFRRQHPVDIFILDFYCHEKKLGIEVDGEYHLNAEQQEWDENRTFILNDFGIEILRFTNQEVEKNLDEVVERIYIKVEELK